MSQDSKNNVPPAVDELTVEMRKVKEAQAKLENARRLLDDAVRATREEQERKEALQVEVKVFGDRRKAIEKEIEAMVAERRGEEAKVNELKKEKQQLQTELELFIDKSKTEKANIQSDLETIRAARKEADEKLEEEAQVIANKIKAGLTELAELEAKLATVDKNVEETQENAKIALEQLEQLRLAVEDKQSAKTALEAEITRLAADRTNLEANLSELERKMVAEADNLKGIFSDIELAHKSKEDLNVEIANVRTEKQKLDEDFENSKAKVFALSRKEDYLKQMEDALRRRYEEVGLPYTPYNEG